MEENIGQIVHKLRSSIQFNIGFIEFANGWFKTRDESRFDHLVEYCSVAADSAKKVLELIGKLEKTVSKEAEHDQLVKGV